MFWVSAPKQIAAMWMRWKRREEERRKKKDCRQTNDRNHKNRGTQKSERFVQPRPRYDSLRTCLKTVRLSPSLASGRSTVSTFS
jgi:hypothetical protein